MQCVIRIQTLNFRLTLYCKIPYSSHSWNVYKVVSNALFAIIWENPQSCLCLHVGVPNLCKLLPTSSSASTKASRWPYRYPAIFVGPTGRPSCFQHLGVPTKPNLTHHEPSLTAVKGHNWRSKKPSPIPHPTQCPNHKLRCPTTRVQLEARPL